MPYAQPFNGASLTYLWFRWLSRTHTSKFGCCVILVYNSYGVNLPFPRLQWLPDILYCKYVLILPNGSIWLVKTEYLVILIPTRLFQQCQFPCYYIVIFTPFFFYISMWIGRSGVYYIFVLRMYLCILTKLSVWCNAWCIRVPLSKINVSLFQFFQLYFHSLKPH